MSHASPTEEDTLDNPPFPNDMDMGMLCLVKLGVDTSKATATYFSIKKSNTSVVKSTTRKRETVRSFIAVVDQNGMVYIRRGGIVEKRSQGPIEYCIQAVKNLIALILLFFKTIIDPSAANHVIEKQENKRRSKGVKLGGERPRGPRIAGLSDLKDAGGNCAAGA